MSAEQKKEGCCCTPAKKPFSVRLRDIFKKSAACGCSTAGGLLLGHAGCIITPLVLAFSGVAMASGAVMGGVSIAIGSVFTAGGLALWEHLRGDKASKLERRITYISAIGGVVVSSAFHIASHRNHRAADPRCNTVISYVEPIQPKQKSSELTFLLNK